MTTEERQRIQFTEDQRRLQAEVNQLLNQRFLVTTAAITVFGVFASLMPPREPLQGHSSSVKVFFAAAIVLHSVLLLLFAWNRFLANLQSNVSIYW